MGSAALTLAAASHSWEAAVSLSGFIGQANIAAPGPRSTRPIPYSFDFQWHRACKALRALSIFRRCAISIIMLTELRIAIRRLAKSPGFTGTALATLAICIGANLAIFAVVDAILIRSLPFPQPDRLLTMYYVYPRLPSANPGASVTNYYERRGKIPAFSSIAEISEGTSVLGESGSTTIEKVGRV